jgi:hypothetical protein
MTTEANDPSEKGNAPQPKDAETADATEEAAAKVSDAVDRAGDTTPTKPGTEAAKASSGLADHSKHPPGERAESADVALSGDETNQK